MWLESSPNIASIDPMPMASMADFGFLTPCEWCMVMLTLVGSPILEKMG